MFRLTTIAAFAGLLAISAPVTGHAQSADAARQKPPEAMSRRDKARARLEDNLRAMGLPLPSATKDKDAQKRQRLEALIERLERGRVGGQAPSEQEK